MTVVWIFAVMVVVLLISDFCYQQYASRRIRTLIDDIRPFDATSATHSNVAVPVSFCTSDGVQLEGSLYRPPMAPRGVILFLPELNAQHNSASTYCSGLLQAGFAVLGMNFRGQNDAQSDPAYEPTQWVTEFELLDVDAAIRLLKKDHQLGDLPIGVVGVSRGGAVALLAGCLFPEIAAVVTDSGFSTLLVVHQFLHRFSRLVVPDWFFRWLPPWHISITLRHALQRSERKRGCRYVHLEEHLKQHPETFCPPVLLISGSRDSFVPPHITRKLAEMLRQPENYWIVEKARHNKSRAIASLEYDHRIVSHFDHAFAHVSPQTESRDRKPASVAC